jgi:hypothetical protein
VLVGSERIVELYQDREADDPYLTLLLRAHVSNLDFVQRLDRLHDRLPDHAPAWAGWFQVSTDFRRPSEAPVVFDPRAPAEPHSLLPAADCLPPPQHPTRPPVGGLRGCASRLDL